MLLLQMLAVFSFAQMKLSGTVLGDGEPLPGASVVLDQSFYGVSTGNDGSFELKNLEAGDYTLSVSFIGFEPKKVEVKLERNKKIEIDLEPNVVMTDEVLIAATRAKNKTPMAYNNVSGEEIDSRNMGQDIPFLLQLTPSFVATSDAGAGVGYTNFRIRGTDLNRINVSVNGIPLNDAESHGTWFVDQPDMASSLENVQIQRGVGTSTNGAAAFGASINLQTNGLKKDAYGEFKTAAGSFSTFKNTVSAGTGLLNKHFTVDVRLSKVSSDGFVDRATADLKSFFVSAGYYSGNTVLKANIFSGFEETYQAWWGVPKVRLENDLTGMQRYYDHWLYSEEEYKHMLNSDSRTYNYYTYANQVDHYTQDHYQLHFSHKFSQALNLNTSLHWTHGYGYYENFKNDENLADYQLDPVVVGGEIIETTNLVNRKWLDNDFYGFTYSLNYKQNRSDFTFGGGYNEYDGDHFGRVIWAQYLGNSEPDHEWYSGTGLKKDFNLFGKYSWQATEKLNLFADLQYRHINYEITGIDDDLRDIAQQHTFNFFNPKLGVYYQPAANQNLYLSFAIANREPNRSNYVDAPRGEEPTFETLRDWELGYNYSSSKFSFGANYYYMCYKNQLVLTGQINDVGAGIMVNVDKSYRTGIELQTGVQIFPKLQWTGNATFSMNKIKDFTEYVDNWDTWGQEEYHLGTTDLAFSPNVLGNSQFQLTPFEKLSLSFVTSYVGKQYIDNTSSNTRALDAYFVNHLKADYSFTTGRFFDEIQLHLMVNNLFNAMYESNAWVYSYILGGERYEMDGYFPQAGTHFMFGIDFKF